MKDFSLRTFSILLLLFLLISMNFVSFPSPSNYDVSQSSNTSKDSFHQLIEFRPPYSKSDSSSVRTDSDLSISDMTIASSPRKITGTIELFNQIQGFGPMNSARAKVKGMVGEVFKFEASGKRQFKIDMRFRIKGTLSARIVEAFSTNQAGLEILLGTLIKDAETGDIVKEKVWFNEQLLLKDWKEGLIDVFADSILSALPIDPPPPTATSLLKVDTEFEKTLSVELSPGTYEVYGVASTNNIYIAPTGFDIRTAMDFSPNHAPWWRANTGEDGITIEQIKVRVSGEANLVEEEVNFSDRTLEKAIRDAINKPNGPIYYPSDLKDLEILHNLHYWCRAWRLESLGGINKCEWLRELYLWYCDELSNSTFPFRPLNYLPRLEVLSIRYMESIDLRAISSLIVPIRELDLSHNDLENLAGIFEYFDTDGPNWASELKVLNLSYNNLKVVGFGRAGAMNSIEELYYDNNQVDFISSSVPKNLTVLSLHNNKLKSIDNISELNKLIDLDLSKNNINHVDPLSELYQLEKLNLANNNITDLSPLAHLPYLTELHLEGNNIENIDPLVSNAGLAEGDIVYLNDNPLSSESEQNLQQLRDRGVKVRYKIGFPTNLNAVPTSPSQIKLNWQDNSVNEDGFKIYRKKLNQETYSKINTVSSNTETYLDKDLSSNSTYCYQVKAYNSVNNSDLSNPDCSSTPAPLSNIEIISDDHYCGGPIQIGSSSIIQSITLDDNDEDNEPVTINKVEVENQGTATEVDLVKLEILDGLGKLKGSAQIDTLPTDIDVSNFIISDDGQAAMKVKVYTSSTATHGHTLKLETKIMFREGQFNSATQTLVDGCSEDIISKATEAVYRVTKEGNVYADQAYYGQGFETGGADVAECIKVSEPVEPGDVVALDPENSGEYRRSREPYSTLASGVISTQPGFTLGMDRSQWDRRTVNLSPLFNTQLILEDVSLDDLSNSPVNDIETCLKPDFTLEIIISKRNLHRQKSLPSLNLVGLEDLFFQEYLEQTLTGKPLLALMGVVPVKATTENGPIKPGDLLTSSSTPGHVMRCKDKEKCAGAIVGKALKPLDEGSGVIKMLVMR